MEKARHIELRAKISFIGKFFENHTKKNFFQKKEKKHRVENRSIRRHSIRETDLHFQVIIFRLSKFESIRWRKEFSFSSISSSRILSHLTILIRIYKIYIVTYIDIYI